MAVITTCKTCGKRFQVADHLADKVRCCRTCHDARDNSRVSPSGPTVVIFVGILVGTLVGVVMVAVIFGVALFVVTSDDRLLSRVAGNGSPQIQPEQPPPAQGEPGAYWSFDEGQGDTAGDSLRRNPGKLIGAKWVPGKRGTALEFDGLSAYCDLGTSASLNFKEKEDITVSAWVKTDDTDGVIVLFRNINDGGALICLTVEEGRLVGVIRQDQGESLGPALIRGERVADNDWHQVMLIRNIQADQISLHLDGKSQGSKPARANGAAGSITTNVRALGCERYWALRNERSPERQYLRGTIDEVYVYNSVHR
jgi:hypothetical protein